MSDNSIQLLILDRDGVINLDSDNYIRHVDEYLPIESSLKAIAACCQAGIKVVVATNQSGIGRGYYSLETLAAMHAKLRLALENYGGHIDGIYFCPHHPDDACNCRKPKTGMLDQIKQDFADVFDHAIMVGDSWSDWQVAEAAGVTPYLVKTGKGERTWAKYRDQLPANRVFADLATLVAEQLGVVYQGGPK